MNCGCRVDCCRNHFPGHAFCLAYEAPGVLDGFRQPLCKQTTHIAAALVVFFSHGPLKLSDYLVAINSSVVKMKMQQIP